MGYSLHYYGHCRLKKFKFLARFYIPILILIFSTNSIISQYLVSHNYIGLTPSNFFTIATGISLDYDVKMYKLTYNTVGTDSLPTIATGAFFIPTNTNCIDFPFAVYNHGTSLMKTNVPSNNNSEALIGGVFAAGGYLVCMPDYIGMGDSPGLHPYVHGETEATASIDMIRAAREFISANTSLIDNNELFLTGYSQGGHACMATNKYIQDQSLSAEFNIVASAPCSGPYDLSGIMADTIIAPTPYSNPGYILYLLASYQMVYGNIFNSWSEVLYNPYDTIAPPFFNGNNTTLDMSLLNSLIPNDMSLLIRDTCLDNFANDSLNKTHPWWLALIDNDNYDWIPQNPLRMYYCTQDEQVAYTNSLTAEIAMNNNGATDVQAINVGNFDHGGCVFPALSDAFYWFQSLKSSCNTTAISSLELLTNKIFPNPFTNELSLSFNEKVNLTIYSLHGNLLFQDHMVQDIHLHTSQWPSGLYLIKVQGKTTNQNYITSKPQ